MRTVLLPLGVNPIALNEYISTLCRAYGVINPLAPGFPFKF